MDDSKRLNITIQTVVQDEDIAKQTDLARMKFMATALLGVSFIIFILATIYKDVALWVGFVQATAEAAMVGAIADWFAVTALFRHPLGLKIPHTAIIPYRKDDIGARLGRFIKQNFLSKTIIVEKLHSLDVTTTVAEWLIQPKNSTQVANQLALGMANIIQVINDEDVQAVIEANLKARIKSQPMAPVLGGLLALLTSGGRERELLQGTVKLGTRILEENKEAIIDKIKRETPWWLPRNVDISIYQKMVTSLDETLHEVDRDPEHPLYSQFNSLISHFVNDLQNSPEVLAKEVVWKEELLQQPLVTEFSASLWRDIKMTLVEHSEDPNLDIQRSIQQGLIRFGEALLEDEMLRQKMDGWVERSAVYLIEQYGHEVELLIAHTIQRWDAEATSQKIELQVGKDLQYIRINGTLVGGLVGFIIHAVSLLL